MHMNRKWSRFGEYDESDGEFEPAVDDLIPQAPQFTQKGVWFRVDDVSAN